MKMLIVRNYSEQPIEVLFRGKVYVFDTIVNQKDNALKEITETLADTPKYNETTVYVVTKNKYDDLKKICMCKGDTTYPGDPNGLSFKNCKDKLYVTVLSAKNIVQLE